MRFAGHGGHVHTLKNGFMKIHVIGSQRYKKNWRHEMNRLAFFFGIRNGLLITGTVAIWLYILYKLFMAIAGR